jgi:hypothetical protein
MAKWNNVSVVLPTPGQIVWVRVNYFYGTPFKAQWENDTFAFNSLVTGLSFPFWTVARWKSL